MTSALDLLVDAAAAYRLTRLVTADTITETPRARLVEAARIGAGLPPADGVSYDGERFVDDGEHVVLASEVVDEWDRPPKIAELVTCRWCAGMWVSFGVVLARRVAPRLWSPIARALALSAVAALAAGLEDH